MKLRVGLLASVLGSLLVACTSQVPTEPSTATAVIELPAASSVITDARVPLVRTGVSAALGRAPGRCGEVTEFAFVAVTTLRDLGFDDQKDDPDYDRLGQFWVTAQKLAIPKPSALPVHRIPGWGAKPMGLRNRPPARMMCVAWAGGDAAGTITLALPDDWAPPAT
jgi:hypothetical protein